MASTAARAGVDDFDTYPQLVNFVRVVTAGSGVSHFIMHARKCLLKGLNPHQNRTVPPLRYEWVWALKRDFPHIDFSLNGGVLTLEEVAAALSIVNGSGSNQTAAQAGSSSSGQRQGIMGVMVGRAAYNMPWDALGEPGCKPARLCTPACHVHLACVQLGFTTSTQLTAANLETTHLPLCCS